MELHKEITAPQYQFVSVFTAVGF